jgi:hypothetical protein
MRSMEIGRRCRTRGETVVAGDKMGDDAFEANLLLTFLLILATSQSISGMVPSKA